MEGDRAFHRPDRAIAVEMITAAYAIIGKKAPKVVFCDRPYEAADIIVSQIDNPRNLPRRDFARMVRQFVPAPVAVSVGVKGT